MKKYLTIFSIFFRTSLAKDLSFRFSFFAGIIGAFCYVGLSYFMVYFLMSHVSFGRWNEHEMFVMLGNFYIIEYTIFFLFWRGFIYVVRDIHKGMFDYYLLRPADSQFLISIKGGGIHNLLALFFGIGTLIYGVLITGSSPSLFHILLYVVTITASILNFYSFLLMLVCLNFKYGYLEEVIYFAFTFEDFTRYPMDAFKKLPFYLFIIATPFSALATIPAKILIDTNISINEVSIFLLASMVFFYCARKVWLISVNSYSSSS